MGIQNAIGSAIDTAGRAIGIMKYFQNESIDSLAEGLNQKRTDIENDLNENNAQINALRTERTAVENEAKETGKWINPATGKETTSRQFKYNNTRAQTRLIHDQTKLQESLDTLNETRYAIYRAKQGSLFERSAAIKDADKILGGV